MLTRAISTWGRLFGAGPASQTDEERRAHGRVECDLATTCHPAGRDHEPVTVRVQNVSRNGVGLLSPRSFGCGELVSVSLPGGDDEAATEVLACVVRCDPAGEGLWEVGCAFPAKLTDDDLRRLGARRELPLPLDQRGWERFDCRARVAYQVVGVPARWAGAEVVNISCGGVALQVAEPLAVGDVLSVELRREGVPAVTALASVVRTAVERAGARLVGCTFIHELPEEQLAKLLG
ncbi:MAG: PilZ domain-containing protein [Gemmataceae bacterium]